MSTNAEATAAAATVLAFIRVSRDDDGASFGAVIRTETAWFAVADRSPNYSPNAMELVSVERVLSHISEKLGPSTLRMFVGEYVSKGAMMLPVWKAHDWHRKPSVFSAKGSDRVGDKIANADLWMDLDVAMVLHPSTSFETLASTGPEKKLWYNERAIAVTLAKRVGPIGFSWRDVTKVFRPRFNPSLLSPANYDDPRDGG
ncbi:hypothetical protein [Hyphomicrobium sp. CS1BSMeth3]|uniref:hypothetical protein n=1 Tax=Hyphomicrobium sp. CS1BSMeth3 TaxID=1892844 RepID=UPI000930CB3E|nr:hypothetical protein [Hyphomicrobium sp. CS1BSMeth3]